jgi:hypothetical protein
VIFHWKQRDWKARDDIIKIIKNKITLGLMPIILATWEVGFEAIPDKQFTRPKPRAKWTGCVIQVVEHLFCKCERQFQ